MTMKFALAVVAVLCLAGAAQAGWGGPCPNGWVLYKETICLKLFTQQEKWDEARRQCAYQAPGSDLVRVDSEEKNRFIHTMVHANPPFLKCGVLGMDSYWIGANDKNEEDRFEWNDTGEQIIDYTNWDFLQPNNFLFDEDCVEMEWSDGEWDDSDCDNTQCFVCEKPATK